MTQRRRPVDAGNRQLIVAGVSCTTICGVRDYAEVLGEALAGQGIRTVGQAWWDRLGWELRPRRSLVELRRWRARFTEAVDLSGQASILWHYSVPSYGVRAVPVLAPLIVWTLRRARRPIVVILHEYAYPWGQRGWKGAFLATTHRAVLVLVMAVASGAIVTAEDRLTWLRSRWWLPSRPMAFVPVVANILPTGRPASVEASSSGDRVAYVGMLGFGREGVRVDLVFDALCRLESRGRKVELILVGAPGQESPEGRAWLACARRQGMADRVRFTGFLEGGALSMTISSLDVTIVADAAGPTARRTTLAAALAHGCCIVALEGPESWSVLNEQRALRLVAPLPDALCDAVDELLGDDAARADQGLRARQFYEQHLAAQIIAADVKAFIEAISPA